MAKLTKKQFEDVFRDEVLPYVVERYEQDGVPDKPARREAWNDTVDAYIRDRSLPEAAGNWSHPRWLETYRPRAPRAHAAMKKPQTRKTRHHATKKSPAQLEREIAEALSKSGKGHRPSKLGGDYFTVVLTRAKPASTNEWNRLPADWDSQVRGTFPTKYAAYKWAREKLLPGAPFTIRYVPLGA